METQCTSSVVNKITTVRDPSFLGSIQTKCTTPLNISNGTSSCVQLDVYTIYRDKTPKILPRKYHNNIVRTSTGSNKTTFTENYHEQCLQPPQSFVGSPQNYFISNLEKRINGL